MNNERIKGSLINYYPEINNVFIEVDRVIRWEN